METRKRKLYHFATHKLQVTSSHDAEAGVKRIGLQCTCCSEPHDLFIELTEDDFQYMIEAGYLIPVKEVKGHDKKNRKETLDCIFGTPQQEDRKKKATRKLRKS